MNYSIWIIPPEPHFAQLQDIIRELSKQYKTPLFIPHITILSGVGADLSAIEKIARKLVERVKSIDLVFDCVSFSTTYFQSVFMRVRSTAQLTQLNLDFKIELSMENTVYMPHLSLIYGDQDMKTRESIASKISYPQISFKAKELVIIPEAVHPRDWKPAITIPFSA